MGGRTGEDKEEKRKKTSTYDPRIRGNARLAKLSESLVSQAKWTHQFRPVVFPAAGGGCPATDERWVTNPQYYINVPEACLLQATLTQRDPRFHGARKAPRPLQLGLLLHKFEWGHDKTSVRPLVKIIEPEPNSEEAGCVARTEVFSVKREVSLAPDAIPLEPGKYVLMPLTYSPASRGDPPRQCWLSVFTKSRLYPATMLSDAEIAYDDPTRPVEGTSDITDWQEDPLLARLGEGAHPSAHLKDEERSNEDVALDALSELVSKMWTLARQLAFRKEDLEEKVAFLEEEKRRHEEEAADAAAAALMDEH